METRKKKKRGRPRIDNPANAKLGPMRVTPDQLAAYQKAAKRSKKSFSQWTRDALDKAAK